MTLYTCLTVFCLGENRVRADIITAFNFEELNNGFNNSPALSTGMGTAISLGITKNYGGNNHVATNDGLKAADSTTPTRAWRIRSTGSGNCNGWHQDAPQYTQGAQFTTSTLGYKRIVLTYDWQPTTQVVKHQQVQYSLDGSNWTNAGPLQIGRGAEA